MKAIVKLIPIEWCNQCPHCKKVTDFSSCEDSFDEPNVDYYCKHPKADNSSDPEKSKWNDENGQFVGTEFNERDKRIIPNWCPLDDVRE